MNIREELKKLLSNCSEESFFHEVNNGIKKTEMRNMIIFCIDELLTMSFDEGRRYQMKIDGEVYRMPLESFKHSDEIDKLLKEEK